MRIVSLLPSATEIICALGLRDQLVGISHRCDYPPELEGLAVHDTAGTPLGRVSAWYRLPHCILLDVATPRGVVSVPYNERFIVRVDRAARTLTADIPDDLYPAVKASAEHAGDDADAAGGEGGEV